MRVLFPVDEAYPIYKIGGLGDVGGSLPKALNKLGVDVRIAMPKHPEIELSSQAKLIDTFDIDYGHELLNVAVYLQELGNSGVPVYLFAEDRFLSQRTDASDNHADKFSVFSLVVAAWLELCKSFDPQIIHLHDWHTALIPLILKHKFKVADYKYKTIINIHNLAYQGNTDTRIDLSLKISPEDSPLLAQDLNDNRINILLQGILHADTVIAVSPTYAKEILTFEYGEGIHESLGAVKDRIIGIVNGIDMDTFNPAMDPLIAQNFSTNDFLEGKKANKIALQQELSLEVNPETFLIGSVGRVDPGQKGVQLIIEALRQHTLISETDQLIFLGTGAPDLEQQLHDAAQSYPNVHIATRYDETLAAKIYAASDVMIIPSRYEPCGLVQMIAMRYGALPIARKTGGLADTIIDNQDGFLFDNYSSTDLVAAVSRAKQIMSDTTYKNTLIHNALIKDFSWDKPAKEYIQVYENLLLGAK